MYLGATTREVKQRQAIEARILKATIKAALKAGYQVSVDDGEERHKPSSSYRAILNKAMETDEDYLYLVKDGETIGWIRFVYGNDGWDVISDYTTNLEALLAPINEMADKLA